jgi:hypothetical protein
LLKNFKMMKRSLLTIVAVFYTFMLIGQTVSDKQAILFSKVTADWCPKCGDYGWTIFKDLEKTYVGKNVYVLAWHKSSSGMKTATSAAVADNFGSLGQPLFFINDAEVLVGFDNWQSKLKVMKENIDLLSTISTSFFGAESTLTKQANGNYKLNLAANTFANIDKGEFHIGVYLVRDNWVAPQSSQSSEAVHTGVVMQNILGEAAPFGVKAYAGPVTKNSKFNLERSDIKINIGNANPKDFRLVTIVWGKTATKFVFNNASSISLQNVVTSVDLVKSVEFNLRYEAGDNRIVLSNLPNASTTKDQLAITNTLGQNIGINSLIDQGNELVVYPQSLPVGIYYLTLSDGVNKSSKAFQVGF